MKPLFVPVIAAAALMLALPAAPAALQTATYHLNWMTPERGDDCCLARGQVIMLDKMKERCQGVVSANSLWGQNTSYQVILDESGGAGKGYDVAYVLPKGTSLDLSRAYRIPVRKADKPGVFKVHSDYEHPLMIDYSLGKGADKITRRTPMDVDINIDGNKVLACWVVIRGHWEGQFRTDQGAVTGRLIDSTLTGVFGDDDAFVLGDESDPAFNLCADISSATFPFVWDGKLYTGDVSSTGEQLAVRSYAGPKGLLKINAKDGHGKPTDEFLVSVERETRSSFQFTRQSTWEVPVGEYTRVRYGVAMPQNGSPRNLIGSDGTVGKVTIASDKTTVINIGGPFTMKLYDYAGPIQAARGEPVVISFDVLLGEDESAQVEGDVNIEMAVTNSAGKVMLRATCGIGESWDQHTFNVPVSWPAGDYTVTGTLDLRPYQEPLVAQGILRVGAVAAQEPPVKTEEPKQEPKAAQAVDANKPTPPVVYAWPDDDHSITTRFTSLHLKMVGKDLMPKERVTETEEAWYGAPDNVKAVAVLTSRTGEQTHLIRSEDGHRIIDYSSDVKAASIAPVEPGHTPRWLLNRSLSLQELLKRFGPDARTVGVEQVDGRTCDVVEVNARTIQRSSQPHAYANRLYLDRESGIVVLTTNMVDRKVEQESRVITLETNVPIADSQFDVELPKDVRVIKGPVSAKKAVSTHAPPGWNEHELSRLPFFLHEYGTTLPGIWGPNHPPAGYAYLDSMWVQATRKDRVTQIRLEYIKRATGDTIVLIVSADSFQDQGRPIEKNGFRGNLLTTDDPYPRAVLTWTEGKVHFKVHMSSPVGSELVSFAKSVKPVPETPIWEFDVRIKGTVRNETPRDTEREIGSRTWPFGISEAKMSGANEAALTIATRRPDLVERALTAPSDIRLMIVPKGVTRKGTDSTQLFRIDGRPLSIEELLNQGTQLVPADRFSLDRSYDTAGKPQFSIRFYDYYGAEKLKSFAQAHKGEFMAIVFNGKVVYCGPINGVITDGKLVIERLPQTDDAAVFSAVATSQARWQKLEIISKKKLEK